MSIKTHEKRKDPAFPSSKEFERRIKRLRKQIARSETTSLPEQLLQTLAGLAHTEAGRIVIAVATFLMVALVTGCPVLTWNEDDFRRMLVVQVVGAFWGAILVIVFIYLVNNLRGQPKRST